MAVDLNAPLAWRTADGDAAAMLDALQPNILKAHVRDHLSVLLLHFGDAKEARVFLSAVARLMKSAHDHLNETDAHKDAQRHRRSVRGTPYVGVGLSYEGYVVLDIADKPADRAFRRGMRSPETRRILSDPPVSMWEAPFGHRDRIHAVVLVGDATDASMTTRRNEVIGLLPDSVTVLGEETGLAQRNREGAGIEHFGYVDGRSQPLFLVEDIADERAAAGVEAWDPTAPLDRVLVRDPGVPGSATQFGSYLVFRKLEQHVQRFKEQEARLADDLGLEGDDAERAGAMLVGRFEDGTPLELRADAFGGGPVLNDFTYHGDRQGLRCPLYAHIRKVNPRGSERERRHLMARRGQTYGVRSDDLSDEALSPGSRPTGGVGLLFQAFNADIAEQFEYTQRQANAAGPAGATRGVDQVIGQGARGELESTAVWGESSPRTTDAVAQAVTMRGGEYFFMPSLGLLRSLDPG